MPGMKRKKKSYSTSRKRPRSAFRTRKSYGKSRPTGDTVHQYQQLANSYITSGIGTINLVQTVPLGSSSAGYAFTPALQDVNQFSVFSQLYDQYKLWKVTFRFRLITNPDSTVNLNAAGFNQSNWYPTLYLAPDHDDAGTPTLASIKEYSRVKPFIMAPNRWIKYSIRPNVLTQLYDGAITTAYKVEKPGSVWCDLSQGSIPHYGLKGFLDFNGNTTTAAYTFEISARYYFACKCIR